MLRVIAKEDTDDAHSDEIGVLQTLVLRQTGLSVGKSEDLFSAGLDSLNAMCLALAVEEEFSVSISASRLYVNPTIESIHELIKHADQNQVAAIDPRPELTRWSQVSVVRRSPRSKILLTGATGYLGIHMLELLSQRPDTDVACLIRSEGEARAMLKLHQTALQFALHDRINWDRLQIVLGDLSVPGLGISNNDRDGLTSSLSTIYNAGADVSFLKPYSHLEVVNVRAVVELAELAASAKDCHLHHVSSTAVLPAEVSRIDGTAILDWLPAGGYAQSKLAAELALSSIADGGLPISIYRVGELMPSPKRSVPNPKSMVTCYLRTLSHLGVAPSCNDSLDYSPVDVVASEIVNSRPDSQSFVGLANQNRVSLATMIECLNRAGADICPSNSSEVFEAIRSAAAERSAPNYVAITWSLIKNCDPGGHWPILSYSGEPTVLTGGFDEWPELDAAYLSSAMEKLCVRTTATPELSTAV